MKARTENPAAGGTRDAFNRQKSSDVWKYGGVAQLGEHLLCKQGVVGSIPFISTIQTKVCGLIAQVVRARA